MEFYISVLEFGNIFVYYTVQGRGRHYQNVDEKEACLRSKYFPLGVVVSRL